MEEEWQRLSNKVHEALEEVQHVRDRVKKMCHELGQVCEMPAEKAPPPKQVDEAALTAKLKMLMSNFSQEAGQPQPQEDRTDMCRRMMSERDEVLRLEKELETLQLTLVKPSDLPDLGCVVSDRPEGRPVADTAAGQTDSSSGGSEKADSEPTPKAKAMGGPGLRASRSSLPKPPPPKAKAKVRPQASEEDLGEDVLSSRLVNLHWRASQAPPEETEIFVGKDGYLQCMSTMMERWTLDRAERMRKSISSFEGRAGAVEAERHDVGNDPSQTPVRRRRKTVFNAADVVPIPELPQNQLEDLFAARAATFDISSLRSTSTSDSVSSLIVDSTHQRILDIMLRQEAMQRQRESGNIRTDAVEHAVTELVGMLRSCDFSRLTRSVLNDLKKVVVHHMEGAQNVLSFVQSRGEEALSRLEHPHLHRLLYGVLRIPAIATRLECMDLVAKFPTETESCREDLKTLRGALVQIRDREAAFRSFWTMATKLGNTLNGTTAPGFRLSSLSKLMDLKSPEQKEMTFFHFVLLQLPRATVDALTDPELINSLKEASCKRTHTVHQDVVVHLDSFRRLESFVKTGTFKGESIPSMPDGDVFHQAMADFVGESQEVCAELWTLSLEVFQSYRDLGMFFNDLSYVYPPPGGADEDRRKDLFGVLSRFVSDCSKAQQDIAMEGLCLSDAKAQKMEVSEVSSAPVRPEAHAPPISPIMPSSPSMPSGPPPKRGPGSHRHQTQPPGSPCLPGTPSHVVTSPTTSSPEYCRLARKSLTGWAQKACSQTLGTSAARVRGEEGSGSSLSDLSSYSRSLDYSSRSSSESSSSFGSSDSRGSKGPQLDPHPDLQKLLVKEVKQRQSGSLGSTSSRSTPRSSAGSPWDTGDYAGLATGIEMISREGDRMTSQPSSQVTEAMLAATATFFPAAPRKSRTSPLLSPVKERSETPHRIACQ